MEPDLFGYTQGTDTLADAKREWELTIIEKGGDCPCCGRFGKVYPRAVNKTMAKSLIWLAGNKVGWVNVPELAPRWLVRSNQLASLRWWGLVERNDENLGDQKHSGYWRATTRGRLFARNMVKIPKKVFTYAGVPTGFSDDHVSISDIIANFSYAEVMGSE